MARQKDWEKRADISKADYIFLEAMRQNSLDRKDSYFELLERAYQLNPADNYIGSECGINIIRLSQGDSVEIDRGYRLMQAYADENPGDFYKSLLFATVAQSLGRNTEALETWQKLHILFPERDEVTLKYADALTSSRDDANISRALALFDTIEISQGRSIQLSSQKIQLHYLQRDTTALLGEVRSLLASSPDNVEYNVFAGDIYSQFETGDSALMFYNKAVEIDPTSGLAYYSRANYYRAQGDSVAYDREVFQALRQEDLDVVPKLEILKEYISALYTDSLQQPRINDLFKSLIDMHPHEVDIHNLYCDYLIAVKNYPAAAEQASYALDIEPADEQRWLALSSLYLQTRDFEKATQAARRGLKYFPENPSLYLIGASGYTQIDKYDEALDMLDEGLEVTDTNDVATRSELYSAIGDAYYAAGETDSAFVYYGIAIELDPGNLTALNNYAYYLACEDLDLDRAEDLIKQVVAERPEEATSLDTYAWVLFKKKDYPAAKEAIDEAMEYSTDLSAEILEHAGDIYFMNREPDAALEFWQEALKLEPDNDLLMRKVKHKTYFFK